MVELLRAEPGTIRRPEVNERYRQWLTSQVICGKPQANEAIQIVDDVLRDGQTIGNLVTNLSAEGPFLVEGEIDGRRFALEYDGTAFFDRRREADEAELTTAEGKISMPIVQALGISMVNGGPGLAAFGTPRLDGSDKAAGQVAARLRYLDDEQDWFYAWLSFPDPARDRGARLIKLSAEKDCDQGRAGVIFADYQQHEGWLIPCTKTVVHDLVEQPDYRFVTQRIQILPNGWPTARARSRQMEVLTEDRP